MALTGTMAVFAAALLGRMIAADLSVAGRTMAVEAYGLALLPGVIGVVFWPDRRPLLLSPPAVGGGLVAGVVFVVVGGVDAVLGSTNDVLVSVLLLAVLPLSLFWPRPAILRLCLLLAGAAVAATGASAVTSPFALILLVLAAAVALDATNRAAAETVPALGGSTETRVRPRAVEVAAVFLVVTLAGVVAANFLRPKPPQRSAESRDLAQRGRPVQGAAPADRPSEEVAPVREVDVTERESSSGDAKLFRVAADAPAPWRAQTLDDWDGRAWRQTEQGPVPPVQPGADIFIGAGAYAQAFSTGRLFSQRVIVEADSASVLITAPEPISMRTPGPARAFHDGAVRPVPALGRGAAYTVASIVSDVSTTMLQGVLDPIRQNRPGSQMAPGNLYLQLPELPPNVTVLASAITSSSDNHYDKAVAVQRWLAHHVTVASEVPPIPPGSDALEQVLFGSQPASPVRLATAMIVMLRSQGIRARLALGYLPGERSIFGGDYLVRAHHAHAWVEVHFGQFGWQRFDPTGRIERAQQEDSFLNRLLRLLKRIWPALAGAALVVCAWVLRRLVLRRRRLRARPWVTRFFERLVKAGGKRGRPRHPHETPAEYTIVLASSVLPDERLIDVGRLVTEAAYSGREPSPERRRWAEQVLQDAMAAPKPPHPVDPGSFGQSVR